MLPPSRFVVPEVLAGSRLDLFLSRQDPDHSRSLYQRAIADGRVRLNGRRAKKWERVATGDAVDVEPFGPPAAGPLPDPAVPLVVVHEDEAILVVDKAAGVPVHPHRADERGTLAGALVARYPDLVGVGPQPLEPGLVHRLDTQTSGLLVVARTPAAFRALASAFAERRVEKVYLALVLGAPPAQTTITTPVGHHPTDPRRMVVEGDPAGPPRSPRPAVTHLRIRRRFAGYAEVEVRIDTGRMHQIRVHLASIGHPLAGDALYQKPAEFARDRLGLARPFLHAARLAFDHPADGRRLEFGAPLPPDLVTALARLEEAGAEGAPAALAAAAPARPRRRAKPAPRPPGRTFIRRPGGGRRAEAEGPAEAAPPGVAGSAAPAGQPRSWLDLEAPGEEDLSAAPLPEAAVPLGAPAPPAAGVSREADRRAPGRTRPGRAPRWERPSRPERPFGRERPPRRHDEGPPRRRDERPAGRRDEGPPRRRERKGRVETRRAEPRRPEASGAPRPGEVFGADSDRPRRGDRQVRDARRAGVFAPTGRPGRAAREAARRGRDAGASFGRDAGASFGREAGSRRRFDGERGGGRRRARDLEEAPRRAGRGGHGRSRDAADGPRGAPDGAPRFRDGAPRSRDGAPRSRDGAPRSRDGAPRSRDGAPRSRNGAPRPRFARGAGDGPRGAPDGAPRPRVGPGKPGGPRPGPGGPRSRDGAPRPRPGGGPRPRPPR